MKTKCQLSRNTDAYIERYHFILKEMIEQMSCVTPTQSVSGNFIAQMLPHHHAAIKMSENLLQYTINIPLQNIAENIISSQKKSIAHLTAAAANCRAFCNTLGELTVYQKDNNRILKDMFEDMACADTTNAIDANFMREMIPHHKGAILMSENALRYPLCPELIPILDAIIASQKRGVRQMQLLLKQAACQQGSF